MLKLVKTVCKKSRECSLSNICANIPVEIHGYQKSKKHKIDVLFVGEASGKTEEERSQPFIGVTGQLLRSTIQHLFQKYKFSYALSNVVKARPRDAKNNNCKPTSKECKTCGSYLQGEIKLFNPKIIVSLGAVAYNYLYFGETEKSIANNAATMSIAENRGCIRTIKIKNNSYNLIGSFHPSFLSRADEKSLVGILHNDIETALLYITKKVDFRITNIFRTVYLSTLKDVKQTLSKMMKQKKNVAVDTECQNLGKVYGNCILTIQLCNDGKTGYVIPISHYESPFSVNEVKKLKQMLIDFFTSSESKVKGYIFWNAIYDMHQIYRELHVLFYNAAILDAQLGAYLIEENLTRLGVKKIQPYSLGYNAYMHGFVHYVENESMGKDNRGNLANLPIAEWVDYAAADSVVTYNLYTTFLKKAKYQNYLKDFNNFIRRIGSKTLTLVVYVEHCGFPVNIEEMRYLANERTSPLLKELNKIKYEINQMKTVRKVINTVLKNEAGTSYTLLGQPNLFDMQSRLHQEELFFNVLKLKPLAIGKNGVGSLDKKFKEHYDHVPEVKIFNEHTRISQLYNLYPKAISSMMSKSGKSSNPDFYTDHRIRPSFLLRTITGRLLCRYPNLQQRVSHGDRAETVLKMYESGKSKCFVKIDFSAHEVRGLQIVTKDPVFAHSFNKVSQIRKAWRKNPTVLFKEIKALVDIHIQNAAIFFNVLATKVTEDMRQQNKSLIFGVMYGRSPGSIAVQLGIDKQKAEKIMDSIFAATKKIKPWMEKIKKAGKEKLHIQSPLGRRRRVWGNLFPKDNRSNQGIFAQMERYAINSIIQGMCSDFSMIAGYLLLEYIFKIEKGKYQTSDKNMWAIINLIHDSVEVEIPVKDVYEYLTTTEKFFTSKLKAYLNKHFNMQIKVDFEVDYEVGLSLDKTFKWRGTKKGGKELQQKMIDMDKKRKNMSTNPPSRNSLGR